MLSLIFIRVEKKTAGREGDKRGKRGGLSERLSKRLKKKKGARVQFFLEPIFISSA